MVAVSTVANNVQKIQLVHLETGRPFCERRFPVGPNESASVTASFSDWRLNENRVVRISDSRTSLIEERIVKNLRNLWAFPVFLTPAPHVVEPGIRFRYRPRILSANYPIQLTLIEGPPDSKLSENGTVIWETKNSEQKTGEFRLRVRDVLGRESLQKFSVEIAR